MSERETLGVMMRRLWTERGRGDDCYFAIDELVADEIAAEAVRRWLADLPPGDEGLAIVGRAAFKAVYPDAGAYVTVSWKDLSPQGQAAELAYVSAVLAEHRRRLRAAEHEHAAMSEKESKHDETLGLCGAADCREPATHWATTVEGFRVQRCDLCDPGWRVVEPQPAEREKDAEIERLTKELDAAKPRPTAYTDEEIAKARLDWRRENVVPLATEWKNLDEDEQIDQARSIAVIRPMFTATATTMTVVELAAKLKHRITKRKEPIVSPSVVARFCFDLLNLRTIPTLADRAENAAVPMAEMPADNQRLRDKFAAM